MKLKYNKQKSFELESGTKFNLEADRDVLSRSDTIVITYTKDGKEFASAVKTNPRKRTECYSFKQRLSNAWKSFKRKDYTWYD